MNTKTEASDKVKSYYQTGEKYILDPKINRIKKTI